MSLRQRGQRPSEATNDDGSGGGYYGAAPLASPSAALNSPAPRTPHQHQQQMRRWSSNSSTQSQSAGYYNPSSYTPGGGSNAGGHGYPAASPAAHHHHPTPASSGVHQPSPMAGYPSTAPPAYSRDYGRSQSHPNMPPLGTPVAPRAIQFDNGAAATSYGTGRAGNASFGSYGSSSSSGNLGGGGMASNPYKRNSKESSGGFGCRRILLFVLALTFVALAGTTVYFRNVMISAGNDLEQARAVLEQQRREDEHGARKQRTGGRYGKRPKGPDDRTQQRKQLAEMNARNAAEHAKIESEIRELHDSIIDRQKKHGDLMALQKQHEMALAELSARKENLLKTVDHTHNMLSDMTEESAKYKAMVDGLDEVKAYMKKRESALWSRINVLQERISRESRRDVEEWFGPGPHRVELDIDYPKVQLTNPDATKWPRVRNKVVIEMASLDIMPHTVHLFLMQVHHGLWNGCNIQASARHIFQLGPSYREEDKIAGGPMREDDAAIGTVDGDGDSGYIGPHFDHFFQRGLDKVSFQEYHESYPHAQWTVGLAGRPGGPNIYINKLDNRVIHGPGGQTNQQDMHNEADPCFGRVIDGVATLNEIAMIPTDAERNEAIMYPVKILSARVMVQMENPEEGWREVQAGEKIHQVDIMPLPDVPHGV